MKKVIDARNFCRNVAISANIILQDPETCLALPMLTLVSMNIVTYHNALMSKQSKHHLQAQIWYLLKKSICKLQTAWTPMHCYE